VRKLIVCGAGVLAALVLTVPGAFGGAAQTPGVTAKSITVGGLFPLTGPAATYAPIPLGMKAYFAYVNARRAARAEDPQRRRGVNGRQIVFKYYDHAYNPATAAQLARRLVEQDKVFATVGDLGTEPVLATRAYMNQQRVPQALVSTGATEFSTQYKEYPWTTGWQPDYIAEGRLYGLHVKANFNGKKIAIVYQNDAYGKDYLYGFLAALGKQYADANVVAREPVETTATSVASNMVRIRASGATILAVFQLPNPTTRTIGTAKALGINPEQIYMNSVANVKPVMDGMVAAIRAGLDASGFAHIPVLSYAVKYASAFYGPFREAADSAPQFGDRRGYQMDPPNVREALREAALDVEQGADMLMVKPALPYLDVLRAARERFDLPLAAYQVSGEYAQIKAAGRLGWIDEERVMMESLIGIKRAGADLILTYFAKDVIKRL